MKALILAAGIGSRLGDLTKDKPKCMTCVQSETILERQITSLREIGITDIYVVTGYQSDVIKSAFCNYGVTFIDNDEYLSTNNMYSCFLAKKYLYHQDFILMNGDVFIEPEILVKMNGLKDVICVDAKYYKLDSMKVILTDGYVTHISKQIDETISRISSIDIYSFSSESSKIYFDYIEEYLKTNVKDWNEVALNNLFEARVLKFKILDIYPLRWEEIDDLNDLKSAWIKFSPPIDSSNNYYIDLDGTVLIGDQFISESVEFVNYIIQYGKRVTFITNNTSKSPKWYEKLLKTQIFGSFDIKTPLIQILDNYKDKSCYLFLNQEPKTYLEQNGLNHSENPDIVIIGYNTEFFYSDLCKVCELIQRGIPYVLTHTDLKCPTSYGYVPDIGCIAACIYSTTGITPSNILGKTTLTLDKGIVIGDRLYTDGAMAFNNNCQFILIDKEISIKELNTSLILIPKLSLDRTLFSLPLDFDPQVYKWFNQDLEGMSNSELEQHWYYNGRKEKRPYSSLPRDFDPEIYQFIHPDLKGLNHDELKKHFIQARKEKRIYKLKDFIYNVEEIDYYWDIENFSLHTIKTIIEYFSSLNFTDKFNIIPKILSSLEHMTDILFSNVEKPHSEAEKMYISLHYLDKVMKHYNINYSIYGGTLLGAIRHSDFIPWDDDIDILLLNDEISKINNIDMMERFGMCFYYNNNDSGYASFSFVLDGEIMTIDVFIYELINENIYDYKSSHFREICPGRIIHITDIYPYKSLRLNSMTVQSINNPLPYLKTLGGSSVLNTAKITHLHDKHDISTHLIKFFNIKTTSLQFLHKKRDKIILQDYTPRIKKIIGDCKIYQFINDDLCDLSEEQVKIDMLLKNNYGDFTLPEDFDCVKYKNLNEDLVTLTELELKRHYMFTGIHENRIYR